MKVLVDYHHGNLLYSLYLLFEKRLGFELFRPIGHDWFTNGYFKVAEAYGNAQDTIDQYLAIDGREWIREDLKALNTQHWMEGDIYRVQDTENNFTHRAITFEQFKNMEFDLIIASFPQHTNWVELLKYQPKAKFIQQVGNEGQTSDAKNILCSTSDFLARNDQNVMHYRQEFDLTDYRYEPPTNHNVVKSFVISLPEPEVYEAYKQALPEFDFKAHGVGSPDGTVHGGLIPQMMRESAWGYHIKPADGFGHVIHKWFASGRPIITKASYYRGKMAYPLIEDGVTAIDLDKRSFEDNVAFIREMSKPENHIRMCQNARKKFEEIVNFDREAQEIKKWLETII